MNPWKLQTSTKRIEESLRNLRAEDIRIYEGRALPADLERIGLKEGYRTHGAHAYVDMVAPGALLSSGEAESATVHQRALKFLNLYQRLAHKVLATGPGRKIDFQNERLHFYVPGDAGDSGRAVAEAVALAHSLLEVVAGTKQLHENLKMTPKFGVGIEVGTSIAVRNGTNGDREPLFIGNPANQAAKQAQWRTGIFLGAEARAALGLEASAPKATALTAAEIATSVAKATPYSVDGLIKQWQQEATELLQTDFKFHRPKGELADLDLAVLTPANTARVECIALRADIDGFTAYVANSIRTASGERDAIRLLHVVRKELRDIFHDFGGRKLRYLGDCLEGIIVVGAGKTQERETAALACAGAGAMRSAFKEVQRLEPKAGTLGLQIGLEFGPVSIAMLGVSAARNITALGRAIVAAEKKQASCTGDQTAFGSVAIALLPAAIAAKLDADGRWTGADANAVGHLLKDGGAEASSFNYGASSPSRESGSRAFSGW